MSPFVHTGTRMFSIFWRPPTVRVLFTQKKHSFLSRFLVALADESALCQQACYSGVVVLPAQSR